MADLAPERLVAIDIETTGFSSHDRIVEVAAVSIDPRTWETLDEFDTLVNPQRDPGPTGIHGITASMLEAAPTFEEIAAALARRLHNGVLIAHNLAFDARMLAAEFVRLGATFDPGAGFCTYLATRCKLPVACERFGVNVSDQHRALSDARACAALARISGIGGADFRAAATVGHIARYPNPRTHRRAGSGAARDQLARVVSRAYYPHSDEAELAYLSALDLVLDDYRIDGPERAALDVRAAELGLSESTRRQSHRAYLQSIIAAARRDGVTTAAEAEIIGRVAGALGIADIALPAVTELPRLDGIAEGMRVCFTGQAELDGHPVARRVLEEISAHVGLQPVPLVTRHGCDLLVAANLSSGSGKAQSARRFQIPILSVRSYVERLDIGELVLAKTMTFQDSTCRTATLEITVPEWRSLGRLLFELGIPRVGQSLAGRLALHFGGVGALAAAEIEDLLEVEGIGPGVAGCVRAFFADPANQRVVKELCSVDFEYSQPEPIADSHPRGIAGRIFVLTGALAGFTRQQARERIRAHGGRVADSVSRKTDYLVVGHKPGAKLRRARELGVAVIDEAGLQRLLAP